MEEILLPMKIVGAVGLLLGVGLSIASKTLRVFIDPKIARIQNILPGANCGACGFPGCAAFAKAVAAGKAQPAACIPGGEKITANIADIIGVSAVTKEPMMAVVHCKGGKDAAKDRSVYNGIADCHAAALVGNGAKICPSGCLGLGSCVRACPFGAIKINEKEIAVIDHEVCCGCGKCVRSCPRKIISLIPQVHKVYLACANRDKGANVKKYCTVGCTACTLCVKATPSNTITIEDNLPRLDYTTNEIFIIAHAKCPVKCFVDLAKKRPRANIDTKCTGCGECAKICPIKDAVRGAEGERHQIDKNKCIGCGLCLNVCPPKAITLWGGLGYDSMEKQKRQRTTSTG